MQSKIINLPHISEIGDDQKQKSFWGTALKTVFHLIKFLRI